MRPVNKILIIMPNWIGDCLMAMPIAHILKDKLDNARVGVLVHKRTEALFKDNPFIDDILVYTDKENIFCRLRTIFKIARRHFSTAIVLKPSFTKSFICKLSGIKDVIGPDSDKFNFINKPVWLAGPIHKMDSYLNMVQGLGLDTQGYLPEVFLSPENEKKARQLLSDVTGKRYKVVIHPKANWSPKMWPLEYFAELADKLIEEIGAQVIITGATEDIPLASDIQKLMKHKPVVLAGKTGLGLLAALLKKCDLFISGDTGIMHLAASVGIDFIALFGPTSPDLTLPRTKSNYRLLFENRECKVPCNRLDCRDNICMKKITVGQVAELTKDILSCRKRY